MVLSPSSCTAMYADFCTPTIILVPLITHWKISRTIWLFIIVRFCIAVFFYAAFVCFANLIFLTQDLGLNEQWRRDIGLMVVEMGELLRFLVFEILTIIMVAVLHLLLRRVEPVTDIRIGILEIVFETLDTFFDFTRLILFGIMLACIIRVSVINFILLTIADFSMVLGRNFRFVVILVLSLFSSVVLLSQMIIQLRYFHENKVISCTPNGTTISLDVNTLIGFGKLNRQEYLSKSAITYIIIIALVTIFLILLNENRKRISELGWSGVRMFNDNIFLNSNKKISSHIFYLLKYGFYRYGVELTCIFIALLINYRSDVWTTVYSFWLVIFILAFNSSLMTAVWTCFKYFLLVVVPLQYAVVLALFPEQCFGYALKPDTLMSKMYTWLFLPMGQWRPDPIVLCWDTIVFLLTLRQSNVFEFEGSMGIVQIAKMSNSPKIFLDTDPMVYRRTTFGLVRYALFWLLPNISAIWFFMAATDQSNIYTLLYGICFALILWNIDSYFTTTSGRPRRLWKRLQIANVLIILWKTCMQIPGCIFRDEFREYKYRWPGTVFGVSCLKTQDYVNDKFLTWDILCFISMLFHDRFLRSPFYIGMAIEAELTKKFSFKAAKILKELHEKELAETYKRYERNLRKIRKNMKRLVEAQKRTFGKKLRKPMTHQDAVTSGDYYMFQDSPSTGIELCGLDSESDPDRDSKKQTNEEDTGESSPNIVKLIETVIKSDMEEAVKLAEATQSPATKTTTDSKVTETAEPEEAEESTTSNRSSPFADGNSATNTTLPPSAKLSRSSLSSSLTISSIGQVQQERQHEDEKEDSCDSCNIVFINDKFLVGRKPSSRSLPPKHSLLVSIPSKQLSRSLEHPLSTTTIKPSTSLSTDGALPESPSVPNVYSTEHTYYERLIILLKFLKACIYGAMISLSQFFNVIARDHKYIMLQLDKAKHAQRGEMLPRTSSSSSVVDAKKEFSPFVRLLLSTNDLIMSRFNSICFFFVLLVQTRNPTIYVLPLSLMVLLWGSLSVPRPSKILVMFDGVFRSPLVDDNSKFVAGNNTLEVNPFFTVERKENFSIYYLFILLAVLWHRSMLRNLGLWDVEDSPELKWRGNLIRKPWHSLKRFFAQLSNDKGDKIPVDVYTHMFFCDFVNIFIFIFGFASLTERKEEGVSKYFYENKIPPALLLIFVVQCVVIFLDRWIYLQRNLKAKIIFQYFQIVIVHFLLFIMLQGLTLSRMNTMVFPTLWYTVKFIYFILSAYQIRNGYPSSVSGHALCQSYGIVNLYLYQLYLICPFVYELRTVTDWMWTETTLTLSEWLGMEDIFCTVFVLKCWRDYDNNYSYRRSEKITGTVKVLVGGGIVLIFFMLLVFPLAFFAYGHVTGKANIPQNMELSFRVGPYNPIYVGYSGEIRSFTPKEWSKFQGLYEHSPTAFTFLSEYYHDDVGVVRFSNFSMKNWIMPPIAIQEMIRQLQAGHRMEIAAEWKLNRRTVDHKRQTLVSGRQVVELSNEQKHQLLRIIHLLESKSFVVRDLIPKFLKVGTFTVANPVEVMSLETEDGRRTMTPFMSALFEINRENSSMWWTVVEYDETDTKVQLIDQVNMQNDLVIYTFNDKIFPTGIISYVSAQGILGLYTTFLLSFGFIIRRMCRGRVNQIFLDYLPNVDCVLQLLLDIYFVRENGDSRLEEDLYAKLIFLFRSPETLIQWTRNRTDPDVN